MYHYDNEHIYDCSKCRHVALVPGCIFHPEYKPSKNNYPSNKNGKRMTVSRRLVERIKELMK